MNTSNPKNEPAVRTPDLAASASLPSHARGTRSSGGMRRAVVLLVTMFLCATATVAIYAWQRGQRGRAAVRLAMERLQTALAQASEAPVAGAASADEPAGGGAAPGPAAVGGGYGGGPAGTYPPGGMMPGGSIGPGMDMAMPGPYGSMMGPPGMMSGPGMMPMDPGQAARQELQARAEPILQRLREAKTDEQRAAIRRELSVVLEGYFDQDMQRRLAELAKIEARVKRLREQFDKRQRAKEDILQLQLKLLENEASGLGFFGSSAPAQPAEGGGMMGPSLPGTPPMGMPGGMPGMGSSTYPPAAGGDARPTLTLPAEQAPPAGPTDGARTDPPVIATLPGASAAARPAAQPATSGAEEVAVLEAELAAAETKLLLVKSQHAAGRTTAESLQDAEAAVNVTKARLVKARREYAAQERLLQLDLQDAQTRLLAAETALSDATETNRQSPGSIPSGRVKDKELAVEQARSALERAKTLLDLHCKADPPKKEPAREPAPKERSANEPSPKKTPPTP